MNATKLSDIQFLANDYDDGNYKRNSQINDKIKEDRGYPYIIDAIAREQFNAIESNNSTDTLLSTSLSNDLSMQDKKVLYDNVNEYFTNNFIDDDYDDDFEFLYPIDSIYVSGIDRIIPSVFDKKTTIELGTWESCEELYNGGPEAIHKAFISRGESIYNDDALKFNSELSKRYIHLERKSLLYRKFINELDTYLDTNDKCYYVDLNTGLINDGSVIYFV